LFEVKRMGVSDYAFAVELANRIGWNMVEADFEFASILEPEGCFVLHDGSKRIGVATSVCYGNLGWLGNLAVEENSRRHGAGSLLLRHALDYLRGKGVQTVGLFSYMWLTRYYAQFGFEADVEFAVMHGKPSKPKPSVKVNQVSLEHASSLARFDEAFYHAYRQKLLQAILSRENSFIYACCKDEGILGYVGAKVFGNSTEVGPLVCRLEHANVAFSLLKAVFSRITGEAFVYVPKKEVALIKLLTRLGLRESFSVVRMFLGTRVSETCIYTAESLERG